MKIANSAVAMSASRTYQKTEMSFISTTTERNSPAASLRLSRDGLKNLRQFREQLRNLDREPLQQEAAEKTNASPLDLLSKEDDAQIKMLKRLLEALKKALSKDKGDLMPEENADPLLRPGDVGGNRVLDLTSGQMTPGIPPAVLTRTTTVSSFFSEEEVTSFTTTGIVQTADGRQIEFGLNLELSRSFTRESTLITETTEKILCDPLVINLDTNAASVSDQKFYFDLDADGKEESISFVGEGSGFLALDKNGDGVINDGTELFGTQNGDGFADLAGYDSDQNGWIDENDDVFSRLKVWTKDSEGNNRLIDLKSADVGAIFLGNAATEFSLNDNETNEQHAVIRSTGVYLKESGQVSTIQHVDLAL